MSSGLIINSTYRLIDVKLTTVTTKIVSPKKCRPGRTIPSVPHLPPPLLRRSTNPNPRLSCEAMTDVAGDQSSQKGTREAEDSE
ncbi:hypothetical protein E2C01_098413 [Portunus trituberculatus]|uniref:Uncharacterized protein n=1 Tax=Portunus trituberculatus TaxID=210409 RepID=A0A5B7KC12_PORTR|nr:hypothetical protein [Portunus trituberculatus]